MLDKFTKVIVKRAVGQRIEKPLIITVKRNKFNWAFLTNLAVAQW